MDETATPPLPERTLPPAHCDRCGHWAEEPVLIVAIRLANGPGKGHVGCRDRLEERAGFRQPLRAVTGVAA